MIRAEQLSKVYTDGTRALTDVNLKVGRGELVFITGESGAGKTTLLKLLIGAEPPSAGRLTVAGVELDRASVHEIRRLRRSTGMVFQDFRLLRGQSAVANVGIGLRIAGLKPSLIRERSVTALEVVGLSHRLTANVELMSWGEQQRVAIARALARQPELILADEPTGNLDRDNARQILDLLVSAWIAGATVLISTHATDMVDRVPGRAIHLSRGRIVRDSGRPVGGETIADC